MIDEEEIPTVLEDNSQRQEWYLLFIEICDYFFLQTVTHFNHGLFPKTLVKISYSWRMAVVFFI